VGLIGSGLRVSASFQIFALKKLLYVHSAGVTSARFSIGGNLRRGISIEGNLRQGISQRGHHLMHGFIWLECGQRCRQ